MQQKIDNCKGCGVELLIVNKKYYLCQQCNWQRLHPDEDEKEVKKQKQKSLVQNRVKNAGKLNKVSNKNTYLCSNGERISQSTIERRLKETYNLMDNTREAVCESCGASQWPLSHSHIISRDRAKKIKKTELIWNAQNILIECYGGKNTCHELTEKGLNYCKNHFTFQYKLAILQEYDVEAYNKLNEGLFK